jgi:thiol-disulfide isomerase/thioredoxin
MRLRHAVAFGSTVLLLQSGCQAGDPYKGRYLDPPWPDALLAPDFELEVVAGPDAPDGYRADQRPTFRLSDHRGKVVLIDFWADWCPPCIEKMSDVAAIAREYASRGFMAVGILRDTPTDTALRWFRTHGGALVPMMEDPQLEVAEAYRVIGLPRMYLIGVDGRVVWTCGGCGDALKQLPRDLDRLLRVEGGEGGKDRGP